MSLLLDKIEQAYSQNQDKTALIFENKAHSYAQLMVMVNNTTQHMAMSGIKAEDKVIVVLPNGLEFVVTMLAIAKLNATLVPLALGTTPTAFYKACINTKAKHVIGWHQGLVAYHNYCEKENYVINNWISVGKELEFCQSFESFFNTVKLDITPSQKNDSLYILTMTSGSTGSPKPIMLSQNTKLLRAKAAIELYNIDKKDVTLIATPLYHSLAERLIFTTLLSGGTAVLMAKYTVAQWLKCIEQFKVSFTIAVSSQLKQLTTQTSLPNLNSLRCVVSSSALLDRNDKDKILPLLNCDFHECYGASEIAIATSIFFTPNGPAQSVGRAIPSTELIIIDESGNEVETGEVGEIACKTPMVFSGYFEQTDKTAESFQGEYFCTGDLGKLDHEGNLYFLGRLKEIIITGGINVYPSDIDPLINAHDKIEQATTFALSDENLGEVVAVALTLTSTTCQIDDIIRELRITCATKLDAQQQPRKYFVFDSLPQNAMGKVNKLKIKAMAESRNIPTQWLYNMEQN